MTHNVSIAALMYLAGLPFKQLVKAENLGALYFREDPSTNAKFASQRTTLERKFARQLRKLAKKHFGETNVFHEEEFAGLVETARNALHEKLGAEPKDIPGPINPGREYQPRYDFVMPDNNIHGRVRNWGDHGEDHLFGGVGDDVFTFGDDNLRIDGVSWSREDLIHHVKNGVLDLGSDKIIFEDLAKKPKTKKSNSKSKKKKK